MKKAIIATVACLLAFSAGLFGVYVALPIVAPEVVATAAVGTETRGHGKIETPAHPIDETTADSNATASEAEHGIHKATSPDPTTAGSSTHPASETRSDSRAPAPAIRRPVGAFPDSMSALRAELAVYKARSAALAKELETIRGHSRPDNRQVSAKVKPDDLTETLSKVDDRGLKSILAGLDIKTFEKLYNGASARNRVRLIQALPPDKAASFLNRITASSEAEPPQPKGGHASGATSR